MGKEFWTFLVIGVVIGAGVGYYRCTQMKGATA